MTRTPFSDPQDDFLKPVSDNSKHIEKVQDNRVNEKKLLSFYVAFSKGKMGHFTVVYLLTRKCEKLVTRNLFTEQKGSINENHSFITLETFQPVVT